MNGGLKQGNDDVRKDIEAIAEATLHYPEKWWDESDQPQRKELLELIGEI